MLAGMREVHSIGDAALRRIRPAGLVLALAGVLALMALVPATSQAACDPLDPAVCLQPWPNDFFTVEDPTTWSAPWTVALTMITSEGPLVEYACHEGNYGLRNILEVARDEEKAAAEAAAKGTK